MKETPEGKRMVKAKFPYCYKEKGKQTHCPACKKQYKFKNMTWRERMNYQQKKK